MIIIEHFAAGKTGDDSLNEDVIVVTPDFVALFDGATNRAGSTLAGLPLGRFAAETLAAAIRNFPADIPAREAVDLLTTTLATRTRETAAAENHDLSQDMYAPASAALIYSRARREIWRVADSTFIVDGGPPNMAFFAQERVWADLRRVWIQSRLVLGVTEDELRTDDGSWQIVAPLIAAVRCFANSEHTAAHPYGFGVINGARVPDRYIEVFDAADAREIVFASDGYPEVFPSLEKTEASLRRLITQDPLMYRIHPQVKGVRQGAQSFDDRSYIRFSVKD